MQHPRRWRDELVLPILALKDQFNRVRAIRDDLLLVHQVIAFASESLPCTHQWTDHAAEPLRKSTQAVVEELELLLAEITFDLRVSEQLLRPNSAPRPKAPPSPMTVGDLIHLHPTFVARAVAILEGTDPPHAHASLRLLAGRFAALRHGPRPTDEDVGKLTRHWKEKPAALLEVASALETTEINLRISAYEAAESHMQEGRDWGGLTPVGSFLARLSAHEAMLTAMARELDVLRKAVARWIEGLPPSYPYFPRS